MLYQYIATTTEGEKKSGTIDAANLEIAIKSLQNRNLIIVSINPLEKERSFFEKKIKFFERVKPRDIVILSRQLSTLFEAKVSALESFKLLALETENSFLRQTLSEVIDDIQGGTSMSQAMAKHPAAFSRFYVSMVRSGEESGKLEEVFTFLADYIERSYELTNKAKNALIYPVFVLVTFIIVIILMLVFVIPQLSVILNEVGQQLPIYTRIIIGISNFLRDFGVFILLGLAVGSFFLWRYLKTESGKMSFSRAQLSVPYVGRLYKKFFLSRVTDSLETSLSSGISMVKSLEIASDVVGNAIYNKILLEAVNEVKAGRSLSEILLRYEDIPSIVSQMIKIGEESGKLNFTLKTLSNFYRKDVDNEVETIVNLIEPAMIILLGGMVGILLMAVLGPIYNITSAI